MKPLTVSDEKPVRQRFAVILSEEPDGGYSVSVPALPGCYSEGDTLEEALANIRETIAVHLEPPTQAEVRRIRIEEVEVGRPGIEKEGLDPSTGARQPSSIRETRPRRRYGSRS